MVTAQTSLSCEGSLNLGDKCSSFEHKIILKVIGRIYKCYWKDRDLTEKHQNFVTDKREGRMVCDDWLAQTETFP
ncbi:hypothetical protein NC652_037082 [Populus alba x Populus x berolinensis]|nr:hypothetical protein NC652_037082 [Populus alba x Populus x berolinensis]